MIPRLIPQGNSLCRSPVGVGGSNGGSARRSPPHSRPGDAEVAARRGSVLRRPWEFSLETWRPGRSRAVAAILDSVFKRLRITVSTIQLKTHNLWVQAEGGPAPKPGPRTKGNPKPSCGRQILFAPISSQNAPTGRLARTPATVRTKIAAERACARLRANANTLQIDGQRACGA